MQQLFSSDEDATKCFYASHAESATRCIDASSPIGSPFRSYATSLQVTRGAAYDLQLLPAAGDSSLYWPSVTSRRAFKIGNPSSESSCAHAAVVQQQWRVL